MAISIRCAACGRKLRLADSAAGRRCKCPDCGGVIRIPRPARSSRHPGRRSAGRSSHVELDEYNAPAPLQREACPVCGEMIVAGAAGCRFCGERFDQQPRRNKKKRRRSRAHDTMTPGDWVLCILCSTIGCLVGLVALLTGKPTRGGMMMGFSVLFSFIWGMVLRIVLAIAYFSR